MFTAVSGTLSADLKAFLSREIYVAKTSERLLVLFGLMVALGGAQPPPPSSALPRGRSVGVGRGRADSAGRGPRRGSVSLCEGAVSVGISRISVWPRFPVEEGRIACPRVCSFWDRPSGSQAQRCKQWYRLCPVSFLPVQRGGRRAPLWPWPSEKSVGADWKTSERNGHPPFGVIIIVCTGFCFTGKLQRGDWSELGEFLFFSFLFF